MDRDLPLKKQIAHNIKRLMAERGWNQIQTSKISGISKSTLSDYINAKTLINVGNVEKLAIAFGVQKSEIDPSFASNYISEENSIYNTSNVNTIKLAIYGTISCGNGVLAEEDIEGYEEIPKSWIRGGDYFLLRAKGDSMINARIIDGDLLLIRKQETFENGEIVAVIVNNEALLKRIFKTDDNIILQSENPKYPPIIVTSDDDLKIVGKLKMNLIRY